jgi:hypothetical protein
MRISTFLLAILMIGLVPAFATSGYDQSETVSIRFSAHVSGECFAGIAEPIPGDGPGYFESYGIGRAQARIEGLSEAVYYYNVPALGPTYGSVSLSAHGTVTFGWVDEDGTRNTIQATIYSDESTGGGFAPDVDCFSVPAVGESGGTPPLLFRGVHIQVNSHGIKRTDLSGIALFGTIPPGPPHAGYLFPIIQVFLGDETSQKFYVAIWVGEEGAWPILYGRPPVLMPAAKVLQKSVEIIS